MVYYFGISEMRMYLEDVPARSHYISNIVIGCIFTENVLVPPSSDEDKKGVTMIGVSRRDEVLWHLQEFK